MSAALEFGRINVPTNNPGVCSRCGKRQPPERGIKAIHWSIRCQRWLCFWCHFQAPEARP